MPTKLNKAGEQQPYIPAGNGEPSGEYANNNGSNTHFSSFKKPEESKQETKKSSVFSESKVFSNLKEGEKYNFSDGGYFSSEDVDNSLKFLKSSLSEEQWNAIKDNKDYMEGYLKGKYNVGGLKMAADIELEESKNASFEEINAKRMGTDRPEFAKKIDEESKPAFDSAKKLDSLYKNAKEKNLDFERSLLNDIKSNPEAYNKIVLGNKEFVRNGNVFDFYENGKHIAFGTYNSVARDISNYYEDTESKSGKVEPSKLAKSIKTVDDVKSVFGKYLNEKDIKKLDNSKNLYIEISKQYDGDDNFQIIDDERIKEGHNFGQGTLKHFQNYMKNNKDGSYFIKLR